MSDGKTVRIEGTDVRPEGIDQYDATTSLKLHGPPGSGKTMNATARVALLLREHGYDLGNVAWITYRRSLAMDTLKRLAAAGVIDGSQLQTPKQGKTKYISTAHAVANRAVDGVGDMITTGDKIKFCKAHNIQYTKNQPWDRPVGQLVFRVFTYARKNQLDPTDPDDLRMIPYYKELMKDWTGSVPALYEDWLDYKDDTGRHMFWEQLAAPLERDVTLNRDVLVVDEYHDAYPLMAELAEYWAKHSDIVVVAGDPHQTINQFDGASPKFYERLDLPEVQLPTAWDRPPHAHWRPATAVLSKAHEPPEMDIRNMGGFKVSRAPTFKMEADEWDTPDIDAPETPTWYINRHGTNTMFLTRTTHMLDAVARHLEKGGVLYETPRSSDVDGWSTAGEGVNKRVDLYNALQKIRRLGPDAFKDTPDGLANFGAETDMPNPEKVVLEAAEAGMLLDHANAKYLSETRTSITDTVESWLVSEEQVTALDLTEYVKTEFWGTYTQTSRATGYLTKTGAATETNYDDRDIGALHNALYHNKHPVDTPKVRVYTIHAAKGNQAENVVLYDGITERVKEAMTRSPQAKRNEYRTWYVALTRSTDNLFILRDAFEFADRFLPKHILSLAKEGRKAADGGDTINE